MPTLLDLLLGDRRLDCVDMSRLSFTTLGLNLSSSTQQTSICASLRRDFTRLTNPPTHTLNTVMGQKFSSELNAMGGRLLVEMIKHKADNIAIGVTLDLTRDLDGNFLISYIFGSMLDSDWQRSRCPLPSVNLEIRTIVMKLDIQMHRLGSISQRVGGSSVTILH